MSRTLVVSTSILIGSVAFVQAIAAAVPSHSTRHASTSAAHSAQQGTSPLERVVSLDVHNVRLEAALESIDRQAHLGLAYTARLVPLDKRVTVRLDSVSAGHALEVVLRGTGISATVTATGSVMLEKPASVKATSSRLQEGMLWGRVLDSATAQPLEGAVVGVKGTSISMTTNEVGAFLFLHVPDGVKTVTARHFGFAPTEQDVAIIDSQSVHIEFSMRMGMSRLQEVVTTATGKRRRLELGNDITTLNADSIVATEPITSVTDLLDGRVPGLVVQRSSGAPGDPSRLRLRGSSSANLNNDPIVIVDGIRIYAAQSDPRSTNLAAPGGSFAAPSPIDEIDPHSIETIEVLKGPSAATLYGADAANGVIVITTKKGRAGPPRWTASIDRGVTYEPGKYPNSYLRWGHLPWDGTVVPCPLTNTTCVADSVVRFQALNDPQLTMLQHGRRTGTTLGVSGGSDALQYTVNGNYDDELGLIRLPDFEVARYIAEHGVDPPDWMQRPQQLKQWGASSRLTAKLGAKADVGLTSMLTHTTQQRSSLENQLTSLMTTYLDRGTGTYYQPSGGGLQIANIVLADYYTRVTDEATQFTNGMNLNWRPEGWLTASMDGGINVIQRNDALLLPSGAILTTADSVGAANSGRGSSIVSTLNTRATATAPLPRGLHFQATVGANYTDQRTADLVVDATDLPDGSTSITGAGHINSASEQDLEQATFGWYVEPSINTKRFWLSTGLRLDGGNAFGSHASLAAFPKVSASYLISDEPFFPLKKIFNTLRLRAAYGHAGVQPGPGDRLRLFSTQVSTWADGNFGDATTIKTLGNTQIRPERSTEFEGGFDADVLDDRVSLSATAYRKTRVDALMDVPLPPSVYGSDVSILKNIGTIRNTGYELSLSTQILRSDFVTWGAQLQVSHNQNVVVSLGPGTEPFSIDGSNNSRVEAGYPLFGRWGLPVVAYRDNNHNGVLDASEVLYGDTAVYLGSSEPNYTAGLTTTLSLFRGTIAVSAAITYEGGLTQVGPWSTLAPVSRASNDSTAPLGDQASVISSTTSDFLNTQTVNTLRFNSLSVAYNVPVHVAQFFRARALTIALQGINLGLHTNYRGKDPDVNGLTVSTDIVDTGVLPEPRTWQIRVSANY